MRILYLTFDGVLQPLGYSQVVRYLVKLTDKGHQFELVSLERCEDLARTREVESLKDTLLENGIKWTPLKYTRGALGAVVNILKVARPALKRDAIHLIHARGYQPAAAACLVKLLNHKPYLFDIRGFWVDERREEGRWFTTEFRYQVAKIVERFLYREAAGVVTLTKLSAQLIRSGEFGVWDDRPISTITTCADFEEFVPSTDDSDRLVVGYLGSFNHSYEYHKSFELFARIKELRADAHFLCLTPQVDRAKELARQHDIDQSDITIRSVAHHDVAHWVRRMDWGLLLLKTSYAKQASMPTKLGEFLASAVRPIQFGCNAEVAQCVEASGIGLCLDGLDNSALEKAARAVAEARPLDAKSVVEARKNAAAKFSMVRAVEKYHNVYWSILAQRPSELRTTAGVKT